MRDPTLHERAIELYEDCQTVKPTWDQLGDVTKSVWLEMAAMGQAPEGRWLTPITCNTYKLEDL